ncbi:hypothetical protein BAUCODRAFT_38468 [Baudoinia panamericana UAMH 10762]|uniref:Choline kinase N-terminal domain-containing protein n=1 Tax=Baudoinia panamericana (strain UAMH 10762) TaxID=717646 RepID=M2N0F1_BAUPA|nr:uncharacterized protein BAUCODRAFT_38468 [Baudoinia panamericana UAMH 10762]EMC92414.1 hypothetical protein BAUCODRAFT_38468 [Baudoinia panamericana UAMH 10762]
MPHAEATSPRPILKSQESHERIAPSSYLGLDYTVSPRQTPRSVSIAQNAEIISPLILGRQKTFDEFPLDDDRTVRRPSVRSPRLHRLSGRASNASPALKPFSPELGSIKQEQDTRAPYSTAQVDRLVEQVSAWITIERAKRAKLDAVTAAPDGDTGSSGGHLHRPDFDLDQLEQILKLNLSLPYLPKSDSFSRLQRRSSLKRLQRKSSSASASSGDDYFGGESLVPACDALLDNSRTLAYGDGASDDSDDSSSNELTRVTSYRDQAAWTHFKYEIVRLAHTLHLKRWRSVPLDLSGAVNVQRLSGALTNAVYVVTPPSNLPSLHDHETNGTRHRRHRHLPPKLLMRIYGPNVEHLIDRDAELAMLRRLARKHIGPRLLGTFANGRFEEYFHAVPLTPKDLRNAETSRQIAKRMRELHDGIELSDHERDQGPFVWRNWDRWMPRVERIVSWLDTQIKTLEPGVKPKGTQAWKKRGFVCGLPWERFREVVARYRKWLYEEYGGEQAVNEKLVFAHNDTQGGNILRLVPPGDSPLLLPANTHKQLVVIDFEYANANPPGMEFANHFTEWCYDYHHKRRPYAIHTNRYPTPEEQDRFVRAYVRHKREYHVLTPSTSPETPFKLPRRGTSSSLTELTLDARTPYQGSVITPQPADDLADKEAEDVEVKRLMHETRLWRLANTAQWVAWGVVQAVVPGLASGSSRSESEAEASEHGDEVKHDSGVIAGKETATVQQHDMRPPEEEETPEFDYLGYAHHRAMFFWGDALQLGLIKEEELPEEVRRKVKTVPY